MVLEDIVEVNQRPKFDEYENGNFLVVKALSFDKTSATIAIEHVALFFRKGLLISFQETESDLFEAIRKRIQNGKGKVRNRGADYLAYGPAKNGYFILLAVMFLIFMGSVFYFKRKKWF